MRGTAGLAALAFIAVADTAAAAPPKGGTPAASIQSGSRVACLETTTEGKLSVQLGIGDYGTWCSNLTLDVHNGVAEFSGEFYDLDSLAREWAKDGGSHDGPPLLRLKPKALTAAQRTELLQGLRAAIDRPERRHKCWSSSEQTAALTWSCTRPGGKSSDSLAFEGDGCVWSEKEGYTRALGVTNWAVALLRRHGAR